MDISGITRLVFIVLLFHHEEAPLLDISNTCILHNGRAFFVTCRDCNELAAKFVLTHVSSFTFSDKSLMSRLTGNQPVSNLIRHFLFQYELISVSISECVWGIYVLIYKCLEILVKAANWGDTDLLLYVLRVKSGNWNKKLTVIVVLLFSCCLNSVHRLVDWPLRFIMKSERINKSRLLLWSIQSRFWLSVFTFTLQIDRGTDTQVFERRHPEHTIIDCSFALLLGRIMAALVWSLYPLKSLS